MLDIRIQNKIIAELQRMLIRAQAGQIKALAVVAIDAKSLGDTVIEMQPEAILIPAMVGSLIMTAQMLTQAQIDEQTRLANARAG